MSWMYAKFKCPKCSWIFYRLHEWLNSITCPMCGAIVTDRDRIPDVD